MLRAAYEDIVTLVGEAHATEDVVLQRRARSMMNTLGKSFSAYMGTRRALRTSLRATEQTVSFVVFDQRPSGTVYEGLPQNRGITIGRYGGGLDVEVWSRGPDGEELASRIHALLLPDAGNRRWIIADLGCLKGIGISHRFDGGKMQTVSAVESTPEERRPLCVDWDDVVELDLKNGSFVLFNPKPCMLCHSRLPVCLGPCAHGLACEECVRSRVNGASSSMDSLQLICRPVVLTMCAMCGDQHDVADPATWRSLDLQAYATA